MTCRSGRSVGFIFVAFPCHKDARSPARQAGGSEGEPEGTAPQQPPQLGTPPPPASFTHARTNAPAPPSRPFRHCKEQPVAHAHSEEAVVRGERRVPPPPPRPLPKALGCFRSSPAPPPPPFPAPSPLAWAPQSRRRGGRRWKMAAGIGGEAAAAAAAAAAVMQKRPSAASARAGVDRG